METTLTYLDAYCERAGDPGLFAEPLNALTNLCFIAAAIGAGLALRRLPASPSRRHGDLWLLVVVLFAIGIGSGLWHLIPNGHTVLMDVLPITLFIHAYLIAAMRRLLGFSWKRTFLWWATYLAVSIAAQLLLPPDLWNGSVMYLPTYITLVLLTCAVRHANRAHGNVFISMVALWTLSLVFRTVDSVICELFPLGTHFLWHALNAWMLYRFLMLLIGTPARA